MTAHITFEIENNFSDFAKSFQDTPTSITDINSLLKLIKTFHDFEKMMKSYFSIRSEAIKDDLNKYVVTDFGKDVDFIEQLYVPSYAICKKKYRDTIIAEKGITDFINSNTNVIHERLMFVCGEPGAGKSTLARVYCYKHSQKYEDNQFYNNLKISPINSIMECIQEKWNSFKKKEKLTSFDPIRAIHYIALGKDYKPVNDKMVFKCPPFTRIIYLDGLDELHYQCDDNQNNRKGNIVIRLLNSLYDFLEQNENVKFIIGTRTNLLDQLRNADGRAAGYFFRSSYTFHLENLYNQNLQEDYRSEFLEKYFQLSVFDNIDKISIKKEILENPIYEEVSSEPLLLSFLLKIIAQDKKLDSALSNKAALYKKLFKNYFEREQQKGARAENPVIFECREYDNFEDILSQIALACFECGDKIAPLKVIKKYLDKEYHKFFIGKKEKPDTENYAGIAVFYFRINEDKENDDNNIEFIHKSFAEYFTALGLIKLLDKASKNDIQAQQTLLKLLFYKEITKEIQEFISQIAENKKNDFVYKDKLFENYIPFVESFLEGDINLNLEKDVINLSSVMQQNKSFCRVALGLLCMLGCLNCFEEKTHLPILQKNKNLLKNIILNIDYVYICLSNYNLKNLDLTFIDCTLVDFSNSNLNDTDLSFTKLCGLFANVNFTNGVLEHALLLGNFKSANFSNSSIQKATLHECILNEVNLKNAMLNYTDLSSANIKNANLSNVDLSKVVRFKHIRFKKTYINKNTKFPRYFNVKKALSDGRLIMLNDEENE